MANQTIEEQHKNITKFGKEIQVHQEREYFLTQKYNDQLEMKTINEENILGETHYFREEFLTLLNSIEVYFIEGNNSLSIYQCSYAIIIKYC